MKFKLLAALAAIVCVTAVMAETLEITATANTVMARTVYTNDFTVPTPTIGTVLGATVPYRPLAKVIVKNNTLESASVAVYAQDLEGWTALTGSPVVAATTAQTVAYPWRTATETIAGYAVTNDVLVATTTTVTKPIAPYMVHKLRLITTLAGTNAASTVNLGVQFQ